MIKESSSKRLIFWVVNSSFILILVIAYGISLSKKAINYQVAFHIESEYSSDEDTSPFYYSSILDICVNSRYIYIADWKESKITIYDQNMNFIKRFGQKGQGPGEFNQIFADLNCDEDRIYMLTINRLYVFSNTGEYQYDVVLKFIPRRIFLYDNGWLFMMYDSRETFFLTDKKGEVLSKYYVVPHIKYSKCQPAYATPEVYVSSKENIYTMDTLSYRIQCLNKENKSVEIETKRKVDFNPLKCRKVDLGVMGIQYTFSGGYSWFLENKDQLLYFFYDTKGELCVDSYKNDNKLALNWSAIYHGDFYPLAVIRDGRIIGTYKERNNVLAISRLELQTQ